MIKDKSMKFSEKYKTREEREAVLRKMSDKEILALIDGTNNMTGKIYYSRFLKDKWVAVDQSY